MMSAGTPRSMTLQEVDELLMTVTPRVWRDDRAIRAIKDIERGKQRRRAVAFVIVGHHAEGVFPTRRGPAPLLQGQARLGQARLGQARLGAVKRRYLAFFVK